MVRINRREFLQLAGTGALGVGTGFLLGEAIKHPMELLVPYPVPPEEYSPGVDTWYSTLCAGCDARCGIRVRVREGRVKKIEGNPLHPVNQGGLCARGQSGVQELYHPERISQPLAHNLDSNSNYSPISWENAFNQITQQLKSLVEKQQGDRVWMMTTGTQGHLYGLQKRFMDTLRSPHLMQYTHDNHTNLYAANRHCFNTEQLPYYDIAHSPLLLSFGADYLSTWLSPMQYTRAFGVMRQGAFSVTEQEALSATEINAHSVATPKTHSRGKTIQIEPRLSLSGANADHWLATSPGSEAVLALALCGELLRKGFYTGDNRKSWEQQLQPYSLQRASRDSGLDVATLKQLAEDFGSGPGLAIAGGGALQGSNGFVTAVAINLLNFFGGNLNRPGGILQNPSPVFGAEAAPKQANYKQLQSLIKSADRGEIELLILYDTDPLQNCPTASGLESALAKIPTVVSLSTHMNRSSIKANLILPLHSYLEDWDDSAPEPGVGFRTGALAQPVIQPLYDTRSGGDILLTLAKGLGGNIRQALPWDSYEIYLKNQWRELYRQRNPDSLSLDEDFQQFWQSVLQVGVWGEKAIPDGVKQKPDSETISTETASTRQAELIHRNLTLSPSLLDSAGISSQTVEPQFNGSEASYPFVLYPYLSPVFGDGRWSHLPWLQELPDPLTKVVYDAWVELNPDTARQLSLQEGELVEISSAVGKLTLPLLFYPALRPDTVAIPLGLPYKRLSDTKHPDTNPFALITDSVDQHTGELALAATRVQLRGTGRRVSLVRTDGHPHTLGRQILQPPERNNNLIPTREVRK